MYALSKDPRVFLNSAVDPAGAVALSARLFSEKESGFLLVIFIVTLVCFSFLVRALMIRLNGGII
jgi:hypothetical protein